jgi:hypothetical protein
MAIKPLYIIRFHFLRSELEQFLHSFNRNKYSAISSMYRSPGPVFTPRNWLYVTKLEQQTQGCIHVITAIRCGPRIFFSWRWVGSSTLAWMPTYVGILRIPQMIWVWRATVEWYIDRVKPKNSEKNLSQCHFVHHKSHMDWPGREPGSSRWEADD